MAVIRRSGVRRTDPGRPETRLLLGRVPTSMAAIAGSCAFVSHGPTLADWPESR
jgi:hypothetical protein